MCVRENLSIEEKKNCIEELSSWITLEEASILPIVCLYDFLSVYAVPRSMICFTFQLIKFWGLHIAIWGFG